MAFLNEDQKKIFIKIYRRLKQNKKDFYQNKNLHAILFGFGPMNKQGYEMITRQIQLFTGSQKTAMNIKLDSIRPGSIYYGNKTLKPAKGLSNGTVIATGDISRNIGFFKYVNSLTKYLLNDKSIKSILGKNFRRKFPNAMDYARLLQ